MKLLLDQNLSWRLLPDLVQFFPGSTQVQHAGLERAGDTDVRAYANLSSEDAARRIQRSHCAAFVRSHQPRITRHVSGQDRRESLPDVRIGHFARSRPVEVMRDTIPKLPPNPLFLERRIGDWCRTAKIITVSWTSATRTRFRRGQSIELAGP